MFLCRNRGTQSGAQIKKPLFQHDQTNSASCLSETFATRAPTHPRPRSSSLVSIARSPSPSRAERSSRQTWFQSRPLATAPTCCFKSLNSSKKHPVSKYLEPFKLAALQEPPQRCVDTQCAALLGSSERAGHWQRVLFSHVRTLRTRPCAIHWYAGSWHTVISKRGCRVSPGIIGIVRDWRRRRQRRRRKGSFNPQVAEKQRSR